MERSNEENQSLPLAGLLVLDFGQFLSAPSAALRLADLGARVIKVERAGSGDICRRLYISNMELDGDSTLFHAINRNKESFAADLRNPADAEEVLALIRQADVLIQNFRPGVMERLGFHYEAVRAVNPAIVYGEITGYGQDGPWAGKPGQDLLVQSMSGLTGCREDSDLESGSPPMPLGLAVTDMIAGAHLVQGILSCLVRRAVTGRGAHVAVSLLESALDLQADSITAELTASAHPRQPMQAIYSAKDGYVAAAADDAKRAAADTSAIQAETMTSDELVTALEHAGYDCAKVLNWRQLREEAHFQQLDMVQQVTRTGGSPMKTTCCPIRIDGGRLRSAKGSPRIGADTEAIRREMINAHTTPIEEDTAQ
ncbi:CaiB/BaiF CoA transferase family protein [Paenibacillus montanisoli]|uniref:CoA transferase n=1 Tax=Paenibacillus montanisoli TaxID=2081970 RepID=A0A328U067_9BACL|nr:CaiB/BaiF CoA-transferase family protein [Paenibacillus montanisoli]RAP76079.1 CoA transferase [Paenibacillus montanisoli]